jgi:hypothetical protein
VTGLIAVGVIATSRNFGQAMALMAIGPMALAILIIAVYPETAHRALEELNPEDATDTGDAERAGD